jgi:hypothetical protein
MNLIEKEGGVFRDVLEEWNVRGAQDGGGGESAVTGSESERALGARPWRTLKILEHCLIKRRNNV